MQYDSKSLRYRFAEDSLEADPVALHDQYELEPKGGMDMVSRQMMVQQAINRKQLFMNSPWVDQVELDKSIMELDDPSLVKRLLRDPGQKQVDELEDEAKTIPTLLVGVPVPAKQGQNYAYKLGLLPSIVRHTQSNTYHLTQMRLPVNNFQFLVVSYYLSFVYFVLL